MEEEHAIPVRPRDDSRTGVAQPDSPVAPRRDKVRKTGRYHGDKR